MTCCTLDAHYSLLIVIVKILYYVSFASSQNVHHLRHYFDLRKSSKDRCSCVLHELQWRFTWPTAIVLSWWFFLVVVVIYLCMYHLKAYIFPPESKCFVFLRKDQWIAWDCFNTFDCEFKLQMIWEVCTAVFSWLFWFL